MEWRLDELRAFLLDEIALSGPNGEFQPLKFPPNFRLAGVVAEALI